jgi:hypothetical protein
MDDGKLISWIPDLLRALRQKNHSHIECAARLDKWIEFNHTAPMELKTGMAGQSLCLRL